MMKKLLLVIDNLYTGGIATSFYNFLSENALTYDISIFVFNSNSIDYSRIPEEVNIIKPSKRLMILGMFQKEIKNYSKTLWFYRVFLVIVAKLFGGNFARRILFLGMKEIGMFDHCIAYSHDNGPKKLTTGCYDFVLKKTKSVYKSAYVHCDYKALLGYNRVYEKKYEKFDNILCVSYGTKSSFESCFSSLKKKVKVLYNFTDYKRILELSKNPFTYDEMFLNFVTVARVAREKGIFRCFEALCEIWQDFPDIRIRWYLVGDGPDLELLKNLISKCNFRENCFLVGKSDNPYQYIKNASCFILPSYHEAAPMVFSECNILNVPVITTNTISANEFIDKSKGIVCDNSKEGIYNAIRQFISEKTASFAWDDCNNINSKAKCQLKELVENDDE